MAIYKVIITLEIDECSVEAASSSDAEALAIEDVNTKFNSHTNVKIVSSSAELE
jgi:hypothetical protein